MRLRYLLLLPIFIFFAGCANSALLGYATKFTTTKSYTLDKRLDKLYLIVVGDAITKDCLEDYRGYLADTLQARHITINSTYDCCVDAHTNMGERLNGLLSNLRSDVSSYPYVLTAVITRATVGAGPTGDRTVQLNIFDMKVGRPVWGGKLKVEFKGFKTQEQYEKVAKLFRDRTITELRQQGII